MTNQQYLIVVGEQLLYKPCQRSNGCVRILLTLQPCAMSRRTTGDRMSTNPSNESGSIRELAATIVYIGHLRLRSLHVGKRAEAVGMLKPGGVVLGGLSEAGSGPPSSTSDTTVSSTPTCTRYESNRGVDQPRIMAEAAQSRTRRSHWRI